MTLQGRRGVVLPSHYASSHLIPPLSRLPKDAAALFESARTPFDARVLQMRQGLESSRHHMEDRPVLVAEDLLRHLEGGARRAADEIEHLGFAIAMMFDELVGAMAVVLVDGAVRGQHEVDLEILYLALRVDEFAQRIGR